MLDWKQSTSGTIFAQSKFYAPTNKVCTYRVLYAGAEWQAEIDGTTIANGTLEYCLEACKAYEYGCSHTYHNSDGSGGMA